MADEQDRGAGLRAWRAVHARMDDAMVFGSGGEHDAIEAALVRCEQLETEREGNILARDALASEANAIRGQFAASQREAALVKERDVARRYATAWKACAKSNRIGFGWWDTCTDAAWSFNGSLTGTLCERFAVRIFVEPSPHAPHGGGYFISANDRRDAILAAIDRIETDRDAAVRERDLSIRERDKSLDASPDGGWMARALDAERERDEALIILANATRLAETEGDRRDAALAKLEASDNGRRLLVAERDRTAIALAKAEERARELSLALRYATCAKCPACGEPLHAEPTAHCPACSSPSQAVGTDALGGRARYALSCLARPLLDHPEVYQQVALVLIDVLDALAKAEGRVAAWKEYAEAEANSLVAAAFEAAASALVGNDESDEWCDPAYSARPRILALTPADARAKLDEMLVDEYERGRMESVADLDAAKADGAAAFRQLREMHADAIETERVLRRSQVTLAREAGAAAEREAIAAMCDDRAGNFGDRVNSGWVPVGKHIRAELVDLAARIRARGKESE